MGILGSQQTHSPRHLIKRFASLYKQRSCSIYFIISFVVVSLIVALKGYNWWLALLNTPLVVLRPPIHQNDSVVDSNSIHHRDCKSMVERGSAFILRLYWRSMSSGHLPLVNWKPAENTPKTDMEPLTGRRVFSYTRWRNVQMKVVVYASRWPARASIYLA